MMDLEEKISMELSQNIDLFLAKEFKAISEREDIHPDALLIIILGELNKYCGRMLGRMSGSGDFELKAVNAITEAMCKNLKNNIRQGTLQ